MISTKAITGIVLLVGTILWVAWDLVVNFNSVTGDTISEVVAGVSKGNPIIPLAIGIVCGHLFSLWPNSQAQLIWLGDRPVIPFLIGLVAGWLTWNQGRS